MPTLSTFSNALKVGENDPNCVKECKKAMDTDLMKRYNKPDLRQLLLCCSFVDPRFKNLDCCDVSEHADITSKLTEIVVQTHQSENSKSESREPPNVENTEESDEPPRKKPKSKALSSFFRKYSAPSLNSVEQINHQNNVEAQAHGELIQYKMFNCIEEDDDPLVWWRLHQDQLIFHFSLQ